jgi:osmoprotectant transport system substrate-binding protein
MRRHTSMRRNKLLAVIALAIPGTLAACGGGNSPGGSSTTSGTTAACPTGTKTSGNGAQLSIGSKDFAEEQLMAQMTADVLNAHGFKITDTFSAADKQIGDALTAGTIDMYWQYTGTELEEYLGLSGFPTALSAAFTYVQQKDVANGICWVAPTASPSCPVRVRRTARRSPTSART